MVENQMSEDMQQLQVLLEEDLLKLYGPVLTGDELQKVLGYGSKDAYRQAVTRKTVPVPLFEMEKRRGKFALAKDVACYLARQRFTTVTNTDGGR
jgi:hypothetical protein